MIRCNNYIYLSDVGSLNSLNTVIADSSYSVHISVPDKTYDSCPILLSNTTGTFEGGTTEMPYCVALVTYFVNAFKLVYMHKLDSPSIHSYAMLCKIIACKFNA